MKYLIVLTAIFLLVVGVASAFPPDPEIEENTKDSPALFLCPVSKISDNSQCMGCHRMVLDNGKPKFGLKEIPLDAAYDDKPYNLDIIKDGDTIAGYYVLTDIRPSVVDEIRRYYYYHPELNKLIIEIHSPGGSVMDAWRIVGLLEEMRSNGVIIQTVCNGLAASAGTILFIAGDIGKRYINPNAEVMVHKVWQFSMFSIADPDSSEDKTDTLKHFQANINSFFAKRTSLTPEILNDRTYKKMWWMTGYEAVKHGIADHLVGK